MDSHFNKILFATKVVFLLIAFVITLYILFMKMDLYGLNVFSVFPLFIPLLLVLASFVFSFFLEIGKNNLFFNMVCIFVLLAIIFVDYRTIFDSNIISSSKINLSFFEMVTDKIKIMLYLTFISNILLMIYDKKNKMHS